MHLGLIAKAKKDQERKARRYAAIEARARARSGIAADQDRPRSSSPPARSPLHSPHRASSAGVDRLVGGEQEIIGTPSVRPPKGSTSKAAQKLFFAVDRIDSIGALIEVQATAVAEEMRASSEGGWNSSTSNNLRYSDHNNKGDAERPRSAYDQRREYAPAFKKVLHGVSKSKRRPKSSSAVSQSANDPTTKKPSENANAVATEENDETAKKVVNFTIYDTKEVKQRSNSFVHYPAGSFKNNGDLIDFQALAVQQSIRLGSSKIRSTTFSPAKPLEVFPTVENGPEWVHFQASEKLTKTYSEKNSLRSPTRSSKNGPLSPSMKKLSVMRKNVSFNEDEGSEGDEGEEEGGEDTHKSFDSSGGKAFKGPSGQSVKDQHLGGTSPTHHSASPSSRRLRADRPHALSDLTVNTASAGEDGGKSPHHSSHPSRGESAMTDTSFGIDDEPLVIRTPPTEAELEAMENLDDVFDGFENKSAELNTMVSSASSVEVPVETNHAIKGMRLKSYSGLETRSSNVFHVIETAPRLVGNAPRDVLTDDAGYGIPALYEVSVFDVGYILPSSNNNIVFSPKKSREHAEVIPATSRTKLKLKVGSWLKSVDTNELMDAEEMPCGFEGSQKIGSQKSPKPHPLVSVKAQKPGESLSIAGHHRNPDDPFLETTVGILVEAIAKPHKPPPLPGTPPGRLNHHQTSFSDTRHPGDSPDKHHNLVKEESGGTPSHPLSHEGSNGSLPVHYHHHHHRHNAATYAYKLIPLRELFDIAVKTNNEEMTTLLGEMLSFGYRFGQSNNQHSTSPVAKERRLLQSQCDGAVETPDFVIIDDKKEVTIHPCLFNMLDRHSKRGLSMLIKNNLEVLYYTDMRRVTIATKFH